MDLFRYISGANSRSQKIDMTVPVMSTYSEKVGLRSFVERLDN